MSMCFFKLLKNMENYVLMYDNLVMSKVSHIKKYKLNVTLQVSPVEVVITTCTVAPTCLYIYLMISSDSYKLIPEMLKHANTTYR